MGGERESLDMPAFDDLDDFDTPVRPAARQEATRGVPGPSNDRSRAAVDRAASFPSREVPDEGQLNMRGPNAVLDRFKAMCKADRRKYADMLEILMDSFEERQG